MVRLASHDCAIARLGGRAALLCACAVAALAAQPAPAGPREDIADFGLSPPGRTLPQPRLERLPEIGASEVPLPSTPSINRSGGAFDVSVDARIIGQSASLPPVQQLGSAQVERMLVTDRAPPAAEVAHVEDGAVVLTASPKMVGLAEELPGSPPPPPLPPVDTHSDGSTTPPADTHRERDAPPPPPETSGDQPPPETRRRRAPTSRDWWRSAAGDSW